MNTGETPKVCRIMNKPVVIDTQNATPAAAPLAAIAPQKAPAGVLSRCHNIADLREASRRRLPKGVFEFFDRGSEDEIALRGNREAFHNVKMRNKVLVDVSERTTAATLLGKPATMPLAIAPTGVAGVCWFEGELALARAAAKFGVPFTLATPSLSTIESVAAAGEGARQWFQLYMWRERDLSHALVRRAMDAGFETLILTVDTAVPPVREYNRRNGFSMPFTMNPKALLDMSLHPGWLLNTMAPHYFKYGMPRLANFPKDGGSGVANKPGRIVNQRGDNLTWDDVKRLRDMWKGPMMIKGVHLAEDAARAVTEGLDGVVISNHGGRNLATAVASLDVLPDIKAEVGDKLKVIVDSGIRRGSDIVKALALGADFVLSGRPTLYGASVAGEEGALHALQLLRDEMDSTMGFIGCSRVEEIGPKAVWVPKG
jgi:(S)-mandelate dehydrogenase